MYFSTRIFKYTFVRMDDCIEYVVYNNDGAHVAIYSTETLGM